MSKENQTEELLENLLAHLYAKQASAESPEVKSYLSAQDGQFLGKITNNLYDVDSIMNRYGSYGSQYSNTSIFNKYSMYGSPYGQFSINNPYCSTPPKLVINDKLLGFVTKNQYVTNAIPTEGFLYTLKNDLTSLLSGNVIQNQTKARQKSGDSFIQAADGTFLGSLRPDRYNQDSIFNRYGTYGNRYSQTSIYNRYSPYGGRYSNLSPYNPHSSNPPQVYHGGKAIAYLTVNTRFSSRIHPDTLMDWATKNVRKYR